MEGTLTIEWRQLQAAYFKTTQNPTSVSTWIFQVVVYLWELVFVVWQHHNSCLYDTPMAALPGGSYVLDQALRQEWRLCFDGLPVIVVSSIPSLILTAMKETVADRKGGFVLVRRAHKQLPGNDHIDAFSDTSGPLRAWAGL